MSHDIRTPMNVIMGFTNIALQHADDSDKMKECLEKIRVSGSNLQELIDDVLDISRIESGEFKIVSQPVKLPELFDFYCQAIAGMAEAKNIRFSGKLHDISHNVLLSDQIRLGQIYMNLLSNAVKYTPENGDVKFEVYEEKLAESGKVRLVSVVSDTGIGMTPEFMEQMYSAFSRAVDTRVNKVRGSGLGLAIVKKIVDLMGGAIEAESKVGKGTTFRVTLDLPAAVRQPKRRLAAGQTGTELRDHRRATARLQGALCAHCERAGLLTADRAGRARRVRCDPDGHADAGDERPGGDCRHPKARQRDGEEHSHHRPHSQRLP